MKNYCHMAPCKTDIRSEGLPYINIFKNEKLLYMPHGCKTDMRSEGLPCINIFKN